MLICKNFEAVLFTLTFIEQKRKFLLNPLMVTKLKTEIILRTETE